MHLELLETSTPIGPCSQRRTRGVEEPWTSEKLKVRVAIGMVLIFRPNLRQRGTTDSSTVLQRGCGRAPSETVAGRSE